MRKLDGLAALVLVALGGMAVLAVIRLGFVGLVVLGLGVILVCTLATLNEDVPTWGVDVFRARMRGPGLKPSSEPLDVAFYRGCGVFLLGVGLAGLAWTWFSEHP